jgi:hypothetical protein
MLPSLFTRLFRAETSKSIPAKPRARFSPALQMLEDRTTPAVTAGVDLSGVLTIAVNASNNAGILAFTPTTGAGTGTYAVTYTETAGGSVKSVSISNYTGDVTAVKAIRIVDSGVKATGQSFTITSLNTLTDGFTSVGVETLTIGGNVVGGSVNPISISATTAINLNADITSTNQPISFAGPVVLGANVNIVAGNADIAFASTSTINSASATPFDLTVNAGTDSVLFGNSLGATKSLDSVLVTGNTGITLTGSIISNSGVTLTGPVTLAKNLVISAVTGNISFTGTVDSDSTLPPRTLTATASVGNVTFSGDVGANSKLGAISASGTAINLNGDFTTTTNASVIFSGAVELTNDVTISTNGGALSISGSIDSAAAKNFTVTTGKGAVRLPSIGVTDALGAINVAGAKIVLAGGVIDTEGQNITLTGAITLNLGVSIDSDGMAADGDVTLNGSVDSNTPGAKNLTIASDTGTVTANGTLGAARVLGAFAVTSSDTTVINSTLKAATIAVSADSVITFSATANVNGATTLTATATGAIITVSGQFVGAVTVVGKTVAKDTVLTASNNVNYALTGTGNLNLDPTIGTLAWVAKGVSNLVTFSNIADVSLTGGVGSNTFTLTDWKGTATLNGAGGTDTSVISRANETTLDFSFTLSPTLIALSDKQDVAIISIEAASLVGGATDDSFDVSDWTAPVKLLGGAGVNTLDWTAPVGTVLSTLGSSLFTAGLLRATLGNIGVVNLTGTAAADTFTLGRYTGAIDITGGGTGDTIVANADANFILGLGTLDFGLANVTFNSAVSSVSLVGGASNNNFTVVGFLGTVSMNGAGGSDTYRVTLPATLGDLVVAVNDSGTSGTDRLFATPTGGTLVKTPGSPKAGSIAYVASPSNTTKPRISYTGIESVIT